MIHATLWSHIRSILVQIARCCPRQMKQMRRPILSGTVLMRLLISPSEQKCYIWPLVIRTRLMQSPRVRTSSMLNFATTMVTNSSRTNIPSSTWIFIWLNVKSSVTLACSGSEACLSLIVANAARLRHIVARDTKSLHERMSACAIRCFVPCLAAGARRRRRGG